MTVNTLNKLKVPIFKINPALNALIDVPMFEDKIAEANEVLRNVGLPKAVARVRKRLKLNGKSLIKKRKRKLVLQ
jgi:hypothetical protein